jgi:type IV pilus assembly protein PilA
VTDEPGPQGFGADEARPSRRTGVTLIELLTVIVLIGVLAAIAIPRFMSARYEAFEASARSDLRNLLSMQELHHSESDTYATELSALAFQTSRGVSIVITEAAGDGWAAVATHDGFPSAECGMFVGSADPANAAPATRPGVVTCTR